MMVSAVEAFRNFVGDFQEKRLSSPPINSLSRLENRRLQTAEQYMSARLQGRNEDVLRLVTDDVLLNSSREGMVVGASDFSSYLSRVKPTGTWKAATWNKSIGKAEILGNVKILMISVPVIAHFGFDRGAKISQIYVGTRRKAPS